MFKSDLIIYCLAVGSLLTGCRTDEVTIPSENETIDGGISADGAVKGFYLLNEGNMGSNKCTLDFCDLSTGEYFRNIYAERNPNAVMELGDVGNDLGIYDGRLYIVVNCSHKVEVTDAVTGIRIGQVDIPNCRYVRFYDGMVYVSSYVGPVQPGADSPKGAVYEIDPSTLKVTRQVTVGYQPEEMEIIDGYMYVANSGGYRAPDYDNTVSVIEMASFRQTKQIPVAINLNHVRADRYGRLWVTSRGNNSDIPSCIALLTPTEEAGGMTVEKIIDVPAANIAIHEDCLYYFSSPSALTGSAAVYGVIDVESATPTGRSFITDGTENEIRLPYGLAVNPDNGDIYLTDAKNYVSSGTLYAFSPEGKKKWSVRTGDIPSAIAFTETRLKY